MDDDRLSLLVLSFGGDPAGVQRSEPIRRAKVNFLLSAFQSGFKEICHPSPRCALWPALEAEACVGR